jgi:hypothetical protein
MRQFHKAGVALLAGLTALGCGAAALADNPAPQSETQPPAAAEPQGAQAPQAKPENKPESKQDEKHKALGAGVGAQSACGGQGGQGFTMGPLDTSAVSPPQGYGAGIGGSGEVNEPGRPGSAPIPQYWLADASLFVANAANTAQTLANEQTLGVQSPSVLGNQAQFLIAASDRALSSLGALETNAESTNPRAVADIRAAMDQVTAAKAQAQQALDAANGGTLGPNHQATIRSAYDHLQAAEREMSTVGRTYGAQGYVLASACNFRGGRGLGAGIGAKPATVTHKAPEKGVEPSEKAAPPAEKAAPPAEKAPPPPTSE